MQSKVRDIERILVYKRTHDDDPDDRGRFGVFNCTGRIRDRDFDAVIGVGGIGKEAESNGLSRKVNWIGIGPRKRTERCKFGDIVTIVRFDHFAKFELDEMPDFERFAPVLSELIYKGAVRHVIVDAQRPKELRDAKKLLRLVRHARTARNNDRKDRSSRCSRQCEK